MAGLRAPIRAVAFDMDGTLYDKRAALGYYLRAFLRRPALLRAFPEVREALRREGYAGDLRAEEGRRLGPRLRLPPGEALDLVQRVFVREFSEYVARRVPPRPGLVALLETLEAEGVRLGVLSDYPAEEKLAALGLARFRWRAVVSAGEAGALKPHRRAFAPLLAGLGVPAAETLYVGDREDADVAGALAAGMQAALLRRRTEGGPPTGAGLAFSRFEELLAAAKPLLASAEEAR